MLGLNESYAAGEPWGPTPVICDLLIPDRGLCDTEEGVLDLASLGGVLDLESLEGVLGLA